MSPPFSLKDELQELVTYSKGDFRWVRKRIFAIYGTQSAKELKVKDAFDDLKGNVHHFGEISSGSPTTKVAECVDKLSEVDPHIVIAVGGGSVLDVAKAAVTLVKTGRTYNPRTIDALWRHYDVPLEFPGVIDVPLFLVPTTAGTGTEVTPYTALTSVDGKRLFAKHKKFNDGSAIWVPELLKTVPVQTAREVAMDAFTHALEAYWARGATDHSDGHAKIALKKMHQYLLTYCQDRSGHESCSQMQEAAYEAGFAFAKAGSTACHGLSFPLEDIVSGSHGAACAYLIEQVARDNLKDEYTQQKLKTLAPVFGLEKAQQIPKYIAELRGSLGISLGAKQREQIREKAPEITDGALQPMIQNNPIQYCREELIDLLRKI